MNVVILCGGKGSRLSEETVNKPKPLVEIGGMPILWHIMKYYSSFGFKKFILALGYKGQSIKEYFYNLRFTANDFTLSLNPEINPLFFNHSDENDWEITFVDTGLETLKGGRIKRLEKYVNGDNFHLTYGDGLSNIPLDRLVAFHKSHGKIASVSAVRPPSRFGEMIINGEDVLAFDEKSQMHIGNINGGFFVLNRKIFEYLSPDESCDFEFGPLQQVVKEKQLKAYTHNDFWQCMDNIREKNYLDELFVKNKAPWVIWDNK
jgi:glucose-1-phosphate cytidylyltransferase